MRTFVLAEFDSPERMLALAKRLRDEGHRELDTHTPYPVHGVETALGLRRSPVPLIALAGGVCGAAGAYLLQYWTQAVDYPLVVGNRQLHSAPLFVPVTFACLVLFSAFFIFFGLLSLWRFPQPHHPAFESERFRSASTHAFWLSVALSTEHDARDVAALLRAADAAHVELVQEAER